MVLLFHYKFMAPLVMQTTLRVEAHNDDVNAVCFGEDSPNIIVTGSDDHLIKVCCSAATAICTQVAPFCYAAMTAESTVLLVACTNAGTATRTAVGASLCCCCSCQLTTSGFCS